MTNGEKAYREERAKKSPLGLTEMNVEQLCATVNDCVAMIRKRLDDRMQSESDDSDAWTDYWEVDKLCDTIDEATEEIDTVREWFGQPSSAEVEVTLGEYLFDWKRGV